MKPEDAEEFTQAIGQIAGGAYRQVALGVRLGVPKALGLDTQTWVQDRLGGYIRMSIPDRREAVAELTEEGMSTREIADAIGVDHSTVADDRKAVGNPTPAIPEVPAAVGNPTPEERYPELANVPAEHRDAVVAELDAMPDEERPAARASLATADVVYSTNEREAILDALGRGPRVLRDLHERAARLIPAHREAVMERIDQIEQKVQKVKREVG